MKFNHKYSIIIAAVFLALISGITVSGLLTKSKILTSSGSVKSINVEVYFDSLCTQVANSLDWGTPGPGDIVNKTVYIKNSGTAPVKLSLMTSSWTPVEAANYITLVWGSEGATVGAGQVLPVVLTLTVFNTITGITEFSFNIIIEGSG